MKKKSLLWWFIGLFVRDPKIISAGIVRFGKVFIIGGVGSLAAQSFWGEGMTALGLTLVISGLLALEKLLKEWWGVGLALAFALMLAQPAQAQTKILQFEPTDFSIGGGSMLGEEAMTFTWDSAFAAVHWHGVALFGDNASSGIGVEIHPASVVSSFENNVSVQSIDTVDWRFWSLNRIEMSALQLPGEIWETMYIGSDLLLAEGGGNDYSGDFSARFVYGVKDGPVQLEFYMFEKYRPISVAFFYRF